MLGKVEGTEGFAFSHHGHIWNTMGALQGFGGLLILKVLVTREFLTTILVQVHYPTILGKN